MNNARKNFLQALLIILALLFAFTVRRLSDTDSTEVSTSSGAQMSNVTVSQVFAQMMTEGR